MLNLDNCLTANRPCIFVVCESDVEVLKYLDEKYNKGNYYVYSTTLTRFVKLTELIQKKFSPESGKAKSTVDVLTSLLNRSFHETNNNFETFVFLNADNFIADKQIIRKIKDILSRYQLDADFTVNLLFLSQTVCVPSDLERLSEVVFFDLPDEKLLKEHSDSIVEKLELKKEDKPSDEVVNNLKGLTLFETEQAYLQSWQLYKKIDLDFIRDFKKGAISKTGLLSLLESGTTFKDIGGLYRLKDWIKKSYGGWTVEGKKFGLPLLKGVLLVGIPGTGKSLSAKALGSEWNLPVIKFEMSKLFSSRVGESENNMHRVLKIFENISPVIVFIDELEKSMAGIESSTFSDAGTTARTMATFLSWMQDTTKPVFIVATANAISYVPPELISRFDKVFFVNLPQHKERIEIIKIHLERVKRNPDSFDLNALSDKSKDLSGRELEQCIREALYDAFYKKEELTTQHIINVLNSKPGIMLTMKEKIGALLKWVGWDNQRQNGIRADYASLPDDIDNVQSEIEKIIKEIETNSDKKGCS